MPIVKQHLNETTSLSMEALEKLKARFSDEPYIRFAADLALKRIYFT